LFVCFFTSFGATKHYQLVFESIFNVNPFVPSSQTGCIEEMEAKIQSNCHVQKPCKVFPQCRQTRDGGGSV